MSPVISLLLLLAFSYVSTSALPDTEENITEKPGTCPADVDYPKCGDPEIDYSPECDVDHPCVGEKKCCFSGCKNRCLLPLQEKTGFCPYVNNPSSARIRTIPQCHSDDQCQGTERCCFYKFRHQCTPTVEKKPGSCPPPTKVCKVPVLPPLCTSDKDCLGEKKCCIPECRQECTDPAIDM